MDYKADDFKRMMFPVFTLEQNVDIRHHFKLKEHPIMGESVSEYNETDINKVLRYIFYLYDKSSPMIHFFPDIKRRKRECASLAGFNIAKDVDRLNDLYEVREDRVADIICDFIMSQGSHKWSMIVTNEHTFHEYQRAMFRPILMVKDDKQRMDALLVKSKLREESDTISSKLEAYYSDLFHSETKVIEVAKKKAMTPEQVAFE
jgi:hypothetical protein